MAKTASNQLGICLRIMHVRPVPKVSIFVAVTTKKVTEKAQKWAKMARFRPKTRLNGRVMAREIFFYQCLWVTKLWANFGCSRTPRTARGSQLFHSFYGVCERSQPLCVANELKREYGVCYSIYCFLRQCHSYYSIVSMNQMKSSLWWTVV